MKKTFFLFKTHRLENYGGTDIGHYTEFAKNVTIFRSLF